MKKLKLITSALFSVVLFKGNTLADLLDDRSSIDGPTKQTSLPKHKTETP